MSLSPDSLTFILTPSGCLAGSLTETEDGFFLKKPRSVTIIPRGPDMVQFQFSELIGKPEQVTVVGNLIFWTVTDANVLSTYQQAVSTIKLASTLPPRTAVN